MGINDLKKVVYPSHREQQLALFVELAPAAIAMMDTEMRYIAVSRRWKEDYRLGEQDIVGRSHYEVFPEIPPRWKEVHQRCLAGAVQRTDEDLFVRADGSQQWLRWEVHPWYASADTVGGIVVFSEDITLRKSAESALAMSQERLVKLTLELEQRVQQRTHDLEQAKAKLEAEVQQRIRAQEEIFQNRQLLNSIIEGTSDAVYIKDVQGRYLLFNQAAAKAVGRKPEEVIGKDDTFLFSPEEARQVMEGDRKVLAEGKTKTYEEILTTASGILSTFLSTKGPVYDGQGNIIGLFGLARDITERKVAEEEIRQSQHRFELFMQHLPGASFLKDLAGKYIYVNPELVRIFGKSAKELLGKTDFEVLSAEAARHFQENDVRALEQGSIETLEILRHPDGVQHHSIVSKFIVPGPDGQAAYIGGVTFDVTDRIKAEAALRESEEKFRMLAENARAIVGIVQGEKFVYFNPYLEQVSGYSHEEIMQMNIAQMIHPDSRAMVIERAKRRQAGEELETHYEFALLTKDQQKRLLDFSVTRISYQGQPAVVGIAIDITERKQVEEQIRTIKEQVEEKNKELQTIIGIVSHDLRAPLVNVIGFGSEIANDCQTLQTLFSELAFEPQVRKQIYPLLHESLPESLKFIQASAESMNNLVVTLVEVARAGFAPIKPEKLDMNELLTKVLESIKIKFKEANVAYAIENLPECIADRIQVTQILTNLLDNAVKYLDPGQPGEICIGGKRAAGSALYWVSDNGIGIALENQDKIFDPYSQLLEKSAGGIGLGLSTVKRMVDRNGGKIWVISEKGKYTTFYVALPAAP